MPQNLRSKGLILILSSPSGGGKSSLCKKLLAEEDSYLKLSISATTRAPRKSEIEGVDYYFKTEAEFKNLIEQNLLLEYATIYNHHYGTLKSHIDDELSSGYDILFDIDWKGARHIRENKQESAVSIFIVPPSLEILRQRLELRGEDSQEVIENRIEQAREEISHAKEYDYVIVNEEFETALAQLKTILSAERNKTSRLDKLKDYL